MFRFFLLPALLVLLLGVVYVLPERGRVAESAIDMDLPLVLGDWRGVRLPESQEERDILAKDTEFAKAEYLRVRGGLLLPEPADIDRVHASVVLSGYDINNSIHRPERCLPAQGHVIHHQTNRVIELPNGRELPVRRLESRQVVRRAAGSDEVMMVDALIYYFFVGHERVTNDHYERTFIDMKDRLLHGRDQRWAYVTVSTAVGDVPWSANPVPPEEGERMLAEFCAKFAAESVDWERAR